MKQLFIGLLIIAAGAGLYYFLQNKKTDKPVPIEKELLVGKWKLDSLYLTAKDPALNLFTVISLAQDSGFRKQELDFQKGGAIVQTVNDSVKADTAYYEWSKASDLVIRESTKDSVGEVFSISKLNRDSLVLQSKDSAVFVLTKLK